MTEHSEKLTEVLRRATDEINKGNGSTPGYFELPRLKQEETDTARRLMDAAEGTALAVEAQAEERLQLAEVRLKMAQQWCNEARSQAEKARTVAANFRKAGEEESRLEADRVAQFASGVHA